MFPNTAINLSPPTAPKQPGPLAALTVAVIIAIFYTQGGILQAIASVFLLAVLITPVGGQPSILEGGLKYLNQLLTEGIQTGA